MISWILWSNAVAMMIALAAAALDRAASFLELPRRFIWVAAVLAAIIVPTAVGMRRAAVVPRASFAVADSIPTATLAVVRAASSGSTPSAEVPRDLVSRWSAFASRADAWAARACIAASGLLLSLLVIAAIRLRAWRSRWTTTTTEIGEVYVARNVGPAVFGVLHPRIVIPAWVLAIENRPRELLLRHELEHLRAGDTRVLLGAELALAAFPWNAALWWIARRLRLAVELDCDARVVRPSGYARDYGSMLLDVGERHITPLPFLVSLLESSGLEARIEALTAVRPVRPIARSLPLLTTATVSLAAIAWTPRPTPLLHTQPRVTHVANAAINAPAALTLPPASDKARIAATTGKAEAAGGVTDAPISAAQEAPESARPAISEPVAVAPPSVSAADSLPAGYLARKQEGRGFFLDGEQIDHNAPSFSNILRAVPVLEITSARDGRTAAIEDAQDQRGGCVNIFVDGTRWATPTAGDIDGYLRPATLLAVEAYRRSEAPPQFTPAGEPPCATVMAWTGPH
jgi:beta-lactamase regulating signal transducer with metallopeptidase domain